MARITKGERSRGGKRIGERKTKEKRTKQEMPMPTSGEKSEWGY